MTRVLDRGARPATGGVTRALVIGCGRFVNEGDLDTPATCAGARAFMAFLATNADQFVSPLWSIDCLISDPSVVPGADALGVQLELPVGVPAPPVQAGPDTPVQSATLANVSAEADAWIEALDASGEPEDHAVVYIASHGIADPATAVCLLEDVRRRGPRKWQASLNVSILALGLGILDIARGWVFMDACQDIVADALNRLGGMPGHQVMTVTAQAQANARNAVAIAGSRFGNSAYAPVNGDPPYFTQTLIEGLGNSCVEPVRDLGWAVTGKQLLFALPDLSRIALGWNRLAVETLTRFNEANISLLKHNAPRIPVLIETELEADLAAAEVVRLECSDTTVDVEEMPAGTPSPWRARVEAHKKRSFTATATFAQGGPVYDPASFDPDPPGQEVLLRRTS